MRVAVGLPGLPRTAIERHQIEAAIAALAQRVEVEIFTESTRLGEGDLPAEPAFHYLRLPERHAERQFDAALHILGRDFRPYEVGYLLGCRFPSVAWFIDTMTHHVVVGGMALAGRWDAYGAVQRQHYETGGQATATIAAGWGTRAAFRTTDPLPAILGAENDILAASSDVAALLPGGPDVVELPTDIEVLRRPRRDFDRVRTIAVVAPNLSWPAPELRSLRAVLDARPDLEVRYHLIKWFEAGIRGPAAELGVDDRIEWVVEGGIEWRSDVADSADVVIATTGDPTLNDRGLVRRAMAAGQIAVVMRAPAWESLPAGGVVVVDPGREREPALRETLLALADDPELCRGVGEVAASHAGDVTPTRTADRLAEALRARAGAAPMALRREAPAALARAREIMLRNCMPHNASPPTRALIEAAIDGAAVDPEGPATWRVS